MSASEEKTAQQESHVDRLKRLTRAYPSSRPEKVRSAESNGEGAAVAKSHAPATPAEAPMERLFQISRSMMRIHHRVELLEFVSDHLREFFDAQNSFVVLFDDKGMPWIQTQHQAKGTEAAWPVSRTILEKVRTSRAPIVIADTADVPDLRDRQSIERLKIASVLCTPLVIDNEVIGVLQFDHRGESQPFPECDLRLLSLFADQVATAFKNLELIERLNASIAEAETAQAKVVQAERLSALGELAGGMAHDFNNTLFIALGQCEVTLAREGLDEAVRQSLTRVQTCAEDAARTVKRLQIFARGTPEANELEAVDLSKLVAQIPDWTRRKWKDEASARGAEIRCRTVIGDAGYSWAQESDLREILHNLVFNAVDAMKESGAITITCGRVGKNDSTFSFIEVRDEGRGMDDATRKRVFEPFFTTKGPRGHGLGLSASWTIARQLGGRIEVRSELGRGSAFTLLLPTLDEVPEQPEKLRLEVQRGAKILIVDDDPEVLETLGSLTTAVGMRPQLADGADEALDCLSKGDFDAVVTDYQMPGTNGLELAAQLGERRSDLPVLILMGHGAHLSRETLAKTGVRSIAVLGKPIGMRALSEALTRLMTGEEPS